MASRINTKDFIGKIEVLAKERMAKEDVISLDSFRKLKKKEKVTVLALEDDETIRSALKVLLEREGYRSIIASDATQLTDLLTDDPIDLILLDIGLPWINGFEVAKLMAESHDLKNIPIIFLSGRTSEDDVKEAFEVGASDYIKKPFHIDDVKKSIKTLLHLNS